jgi:hypothetical protein
MTTRLLSCWIVAAACTGIAAAATTRAAGETAITPPAMPPPSSFRAHVDNPWFPLVPGTRYVYAGVKDGNPSRDVVTVTHATKTIAGVPCVTVHDFLYERGHLRERTTDWYSQDAHGNVWYFGEDTAELDARGHVTSTEGTWRTGRDGAIPGIFMPARPKLHATFRQEYRKGQAEDHFRVVALGVPVRVPYGSWRDAMRTREWTPLEPGAIDAKYYVRGIGTVKEQAQDGSERSVLVSFRRS